MKTTRWKCSSAQVICFINLNLNFFQLQKDICRKKSLFNIIIWQPSVYFWLSLSYFSLFGPITAPFYFSKHFHCIGLNFHEMIVQFLACKMFCNPSYVITYCYIVVRILYRKENWWLINNQLHAAYWFHILEKLLSLMSNSIAL